jgi:predicted O-methyltransferase YrrM
MEGAMSARPFPPLTDGITVPDVEEYLNSVLPERDPVLREMEAKAARERIPIVGPLVARILFQMAQMSGAKTVFEMGSAIGYSTIWWARAVGEGGRVIYTDGDPRRAEEAKDFLSRAGVLDRVQILVGDALELLSHQKSEFDIIFNDVEKEDYPRALSLALPRVRRGGLFISDNVLWKGRVARMGEGSSVDARTRVIADFNRMLYHSKELMTTLLPVRDGIAVALKL